VFDVLVIGLKFLDQLVVVAVRVGAERLVAFQDDIALLSESNSLKFEPIRCIATNAGASWAFTDTEWASATFSSCGTKTLVTTVSATHSSTIGSDSTRIACAIFDRWGIASVEDVISGLPRMPRVIAPPLTRV
jgi:hypothetical protein